MKPAAAGVVLSHTCRISGAHEMKRTSVVYGLAASTLVGAFFLVPRTAAVAPPPPTIPIPASTAPVTQLLYADDTLTVTASLDRGYVDGTSSEPLWMDVAVKATGDRVQAPLAAVLVIDRSGSMAGDKIVAARRAAESFVTRLRDGDRVAVVTYGSEPTVELPFITIDANTRQQALKVVRRIEEGGGTNISGGLEAAKRQLTQASLEGFVGRVVLISDGRPTEGDRRVSSLTKLADELRVSGAQTSTLGLGLDYNEDLMEAVAVEGGGRYHYLRTGAQLAKILDDEFQHGANVVARNVSLHLGKQLGAFAAVAAPGAKVRPAADRLIVDIGDLAQGEERHVLFQLQGSQAGGFGAPDVVYHPVKGGSVLLAHRADPFRVMASSDAALIQTSRRADVLVRALQVEASLALTDSMNDYAAGNAEAARGKLEAKRTSLRAAAGATRSAALAAEADNFDKAYNAVVATPSASAPAAADMVKEQKAHAFDARR
jgi:Ca-activated chloride channel homolog